MADFFPPRPFLDAIAVRVALLWLFLHGAAFVGSSSAGGTMTASLTASFVTALILIPSLVFVMRVDMGRRSELVVLANLGHSFVGIAAFIVAECLVFEVALGLALV